MALLNQHVFSETIGSSGQPSEAQFSELAESGYQVIINLAMHDSDEAIANEGALVAALAMTYIHMPVPFDAPSDEHFSTFAAMMNALDEKKSVGTLSGQCPCLGLSISLFTARQKLLSTARNVAAANCLAANHGRYLENLYRFVAPALAD